MGSRFLRQAAGWTSLVVFSASMVLAEPGTNAMMYSSGAVTVNDSGSNGTAAVFAGDSIRTSDKSVARISMPGATVIVPSNSALMYAGKSVELNSGQVEINTSNGMTAKVAGLTVSPAANGTARYQIAKLEGAVTIAAESGSVVVSDGTTNTVVQQGSTQTSDEPQAPGPQKKNGKKKAVGLLPKGGADQALGGVMKVGVIGAGVTTAIIVAVKTTGPPDSKDRP